MFNDVLVDKIRRKSAVFNVRVHQNVHVLRKKMSKNTIPNETYYRWPIHTQASFSYAHIHFTKPRLVRTLHCRFVIIYDHFAKKHRTQYFHEPCNWYFMWLNKSKIQYKRTLVAKYDDVKCGFDLATRHSVPFESGPAFQGTAEQAEPRILGEKRKCVIKS